MAFQTSSALEVAITAGSGRGALFSGFWFSLPFNGESPLLLFN
jgi:hypothetical protein